MKNLKSIQFFRAVAALMVVLVHIGDYFIPVEMDVGRYGVDIFFVLSGVVMAYIHHNKVESMRDFAVKRIIRIYPTYLQCLAIGALIYGVANFDWGGNLLFIAPEPLERDRRVLGVAWTLSYEIWFYAVFGLAMAVFGRKFYLGIIAFFLATIFRIEDSFWLSAYNYEFCGGVFLILLFKDFLIKIDNKIKYPKSVLLIGDASYSLYLIHFPLITVLGRFLHGFTSSTLFFVNAFWYAVLIILIVSISILNYLYFERPCLRFLRRKFLVDC